MFGCKYRSIEGRIELRLQRCSVGHRVLGAETGVCSELKLSIVVVVVRLELSSSGTIVKFKQISVAVATTTRTCDLVPVREDGTEDIVGERTEEGVIDKDPHVRHSTKEWITEAAPDSIEFIVCLHELSLEKDELNWGNIFWVSHVFDEDVGLELVALWAALDACDFGSRNKAANVKG